MNVRRALFCSVMTVVLSVSAALSGEPSRDGKILTPYLTPTTPGDSSTAKLNPEEVYHHVVGSSAWVRQGKVMGTAWVLDAEKRLLVTNRHVVELAETVDLYFPTTARGKLLTDPKQYLEKLMPIRGKVLDTDPDRDLALVQAESLPDNMKPLKLAVKSPAPRAAGPHGGRVLRGHRGDVGLHQRQREVAGEARPGQRRLRPGG